MKYIVWGGNGFIGRNLVNQLKKKSKVQVIVKNAKNVPKEWNRDCNILVFEEDNIEKIECADCMFFLAWNGTSGQERGDVYLQISNIELTCKAVRFAKAINCKKFVYAGSIMEYEAIELLNLDYVKPNINCIYSATKLLADYYAKILCNDLEICYCNALISNIYGAGEKSQRFIVQTCKKLIKNEEIDLTACTQLYDFIYVSDAVRALEMIGEKGTHNTKYYIGNCEQHTLKEFVLKMKESIDSSSVLNFGAVSMQGPALSYKEFDTNRMYEELGFSCEVDFETGIRLMLNWLQGTNG